MYVVFYYLPGTIPVSVCFLPWLPGTVMQTWSAASSTCERWIFTVLLAFDLYFYAEAYRDCFFNQTLHILGCGSPAQSHLWYLPLLEALSPKLYSPVILTTWASFTLDLIPSWITYRCLLTNSIPSKTIPLSYQRILFSSTRALLTGMATSFASTVPQPFVT